MLQRPFCDAGTLRHAHPPVRDSPEHSNGGGFCAHGTPVRLEAISNI